MAAGRVAGGWQHSRLLHRNHRTTLTCVLLRAYDLMTTNHELFGHKSASGGRGVLH